MLEQGLISEGEEIHDGDKTIGSEGSENAKEDGNIDDNEMVSTEMYVGIQNSALLQSVAFMKISVSCNGLLWKLSLSKQRKAGLIFGGL